MHRLVAATIRMVTGALVLLLALAGPVGAYSYGPTEQEPIVEAYTAIQAALNRQPPAWAEAEAAFQAVEAEIVKDAGGQPAVAAWQAAVSGRDAALAARIFRGIVYENLLRRLNYARLALDDYQKAKVLLNKATITYEALSPAVAAEDPQLDIDLKRRLDDAFFALGNPGVLGVGVQPADPQAYDAAVAALQAELAPRFRVDFAAVAEPPAAGSGTESGAESQEGSGTTSGSGQPSAAPTTPAGETGTSGGGATTPAAGATTAGDGAAAPGTADAATEAGAGGSEATGQAQDATGGVQGSADSAHDSAVESPGAATASAQPEPAGGSAQPEPAGSSAQPEAAGSSNAVWYIAIGVVVVGLLFVGMKSMGRRGA